MGMGFKIWLNLETVPTKTKIPLCTRIFCFSSKTSFFAGLGALFGTFLVIFKITKEKEKKRKENKRKKGKNIKQIRKARKEKGVFNVRTNEQEKKYKLKKKGKRK